MTVRLTSFSRALREVYDQRWADRYAEKLAGIFDAPDPFFGRIVALDRETREVTLDRAPFRARVRSEGCCSNCGAPWNDVRQQFMPTECFYCGSRPNAERYSRIETAIRIGQILTKAYAHRLLELP